jgi:hypothetical protein
MYKDFNGEIIKLENKLMPVQFYVNTSVETLNRVEGDTQMNKSRLEILTTTFESIKKGTSLEMEKQKTFINNRIDHIQSQLNVLKGAEIADSDNEGPSETEDLTHIKREETPLMNSDVASPPSLKPKINDDFNCGRLLNPHPEGSFEHFKYEVMNKKQMKTDAVPETKVGARTAKPYVSVTDITTKEQSVYASKVEVGSAAWVMENINFDRVTFIMNAWNLKEVKTGPNTVKAIQCDWAETTVMTLLTTGLEGRNLSLFDPDVIRLVTLFGKLGITSLHLKRGGNKILLIYEDHVTSFPFYFHGGKLFGAPADYPIKFDKDYAKSIID